MAPTEPTTNTNPATNSNTTTTSNAAALESVRPRLMALPTAKLRIINLDIATIILTIMGALPLLRALRPAIAAMLGEAMAVNIDELPIFAQAMAQAHSEYLIALAPTDVQKLSDEVVAERDVLVSDAGTLVKRKLLQAGELGELRGNVGFANQIFDVFQLVTLYRKHWPEVEGHTGVKLADLDRAEQLAQRFARVLSERETVAAEAGVLGELRQRAFTMLVDLYDQVRRAVMYLRWTEGDVESIAPSLWAGRGKRNGQNAPAADAPTPVIATPVLGTPIATDPVTPVIAAPAAPAAPPIAPGLPGASPFISH